MLNQKKSLYIIVYNNLGNIHSIWYTIIKNHGHFRLLQTYILIQILLITTKTDNNSIYHKPFHCLQILSFLIWIFI